MPMRVKRSQKAEPSDPVCDKKLCNAMSSLCSRAAAAKKLHHCNGCKPWFARSMFTNSSTRSSNAEAVSGCASVAVTVTAAICINKTASNNAATHFIFFIYPIPFAKTRFQYGLPTIYRLCARLPLRRTGSFGRGPSGSALQYTHPLPAGSVAVWGS